MPYEKRIQETGVDWPIKTYRRKTAAEMVSELAVTFDDALFFVTGVTISLLNIVRLNKEQRR